MRNKILNKPFAILMTLCVLVAIILLPSLSVDASASEEETNQHVFDEAGLLSTEEQVALEELCTEFGAETKIGIFILTHDDPNAVDGERYLEDFYDKGYYGDSVLLLIDMQERDILLQGYGLAETYLHSKRLDIIRDTITPYLSDGEYFKAFQIYVEDSAAYMKDDSQLNYDHDYSYDSPTERNNDYYDNDYSYPTRNSYNGQAEEIENVLKNVWFQLIVSLGIGGIVVGVMAHNSGGRMTAGSNTYMDPNHSGLIGRRDQYIRTTVTRVRRPTQNNSGKGGFNAGGFRGGISGGGHSHSSSRGKF